MMVSFYTPLRLFWNEASLLGRSTSGTSIHRFLRPSVLSGFGFVQFTWLKSCSGVGKSKGDTWNGKVGKADLQDYVSFVAFFIFYLANVYAPSLENYSCDKGLPLQPVLTGVPATSFPFHLVVAGYSYGKHSPKPLCHQCHQRAKELSTPGS